MFSFVKLLIKNYFCFPAGTWGLFENWHLKDDYKKMSKRQELAAKLQTNIIWFALGNLILGVFIFVWQLLYFFFNYAEVNVYLNFIEWK